MNRPPDFSEELRLRESGYRLVAGIDEVGRGPLAGPVVAAAVILSTETDLPWLLQVRDSKKLTPRKREFLSTYIHMEAVAVGIGAVQPEAIDVQGIGKATRMAMCSAVAGLAHAPDYLLIDAVALPETEIPQKSIIRGDNLSLSIAAASIVAKVYRDRLMMEYEDIYPGYGFGRHKGYPTKEHLAELRRLGCCPIHRHSFAPVREVWERDV